MSMRVKNTQLAVVTDLGGEIPSVLPGDVVLAENIDVKVEGERSLRSHLRPTLSSYTSVNAPRSIRVIFQTELRGSGDNSSSSAVIPASDRLLRACGFDRTESDSGGWRAAYTPVSDAADLSYVMIRVIQDGVVYDVREAAGNFTVELTAGTPGVIKWEFQGRYTRPYAGEMIQDVTLPGTLPPLVENTNLVMGSYEDLRYQYLSLTPGNAITLVTDANSAFGTKGVRIVSRAAGGVIHPEMVTPGEYHFWERWEASAAETIELTVGNTAGNKVFFSLPSVNWDLPVITARDGIRSLKLPFHAAGTDDELLIRYE